MDMQHPALPPGLIELACEAVLAETKSVAFVVDRDLSVLHASAGSATLLHDAAPLCLRDGRLLIDTADGAAALATLVKTALHSDAHHHDRPTMAAAMPPLLLARHQRPALLLSALALAPPHAGLAVLLMRELSAATSTQALQQLFHLTPSEAEVAKALAEGGSLDQIAQSHCVSVNTVKSHVHHVYLKTNTRRQGELIALIHAASAMPVPAVPQPASPPPHLSR